MPATVSVQEFSRALIIPLPFNQISDFAKKHRVPNWRVIEAEVERVAMDNQEEIAKLGNSMIKAMTEDVSLGKISDVTLEEVKSKIDYLNSKFKHVDEYFDSLDPYGQRDLLLPFIDKESSALAKYKDNFRIFITSKVEWDLNDSLMYSYYLLYQDAINAWRVSLKRASKETIKGRLNIIKGLMFIYKPIIYAYVSGKQLPNEVIVKRIAELRAQMNPRGIYPMIPRMYEALEAISKVPPA